MFPTFQYSGRVGATPAWFLLFGLPLLALCALLYSLLVVYIPIAGVITVFLVLGFAFGCGLVMAWVMTLGKCRNPRVASALGIAGGVFALYVAWAVFICALLNRQEGTSVSLGECFQPLFLWRIMCEVNANGWYTVKELTPSGIVLWILWAIEALVVVGGAWLMAGTSLENELFCETCGKWCKVTEKKYAPIEGALCTTAIKDVPLAEVVALPTQDTEQKPCFRVELLGCPTCDCKGLRFARLTETLDKEGKSSTSTDTIPGVVQIG